MSINWMLRLKNKPVLSALIAVFVIFVFDVAEIFGISMPMDSNMILEYADLVLIALVAMGVVVDPTTQGVRDSENALLYEEPATTRVSDIRSDEEVCG